MEEAVNFLLHIYKDSIADMGVILCAQADNDRDTIIRYLGYVHGYINKLTDKVNKNENLPKCL